MASIPAKSPLETTGSSSTTTIVADSLALGMIFALMMAVVQRGVGFARSILFCRLLPDDQLGQWSLAFSFLMLAAPVAVLGLPGSFGRYVQAYHRQGQLKSFLRKVTAVSLLSTLLMFAAIVTLRPWFSWLIFRSEQHTATIVAIAAVLVVVIIHHYLLELIESLRQLRLVTWMRMISSVVFALVGIGLLMLFHTGVLSVAIAYAVACAVASVPALWFLGRRLPAVQQDTSLLRHRDLWSKLAPFAAWLWVINILTNLFELTDRWMLLHLSSAQYNEAQSLVGQYHSGRVVPMLLVGIAILIGGALMPYLSARWEAGNKAWVGRQVRLSVKLVACGFTAAGCLILLGSPWLFQGVLQGRYDGGLSVLPLTLVYCIWFSLSCLAQDYLWCAEKGKLPSLAMLLGLVVNCVLNALLVPSYGLAGAVTATALANAVTLFSIYALNVRHGWRIDRGVCVVSALPCLLIWGVWPAVIGLGIIAVSTLKYQWIFDEQDREQIRDTWRQVLGRVRGRGLEHRDA